MSRRSHFGTVRRLPSGRWQARYYDDAGVRHTAPSTFVTKTDALQWLTVTQAGLLNHTWRDPRLGRVTLTDWIDDYRSSGVHARKRATTRARDDSVIATHIIPTLGRYLISRLSPLDVQRFVDGLTQRLAPKTVRTHFGVLRALLAAAVHADLLHRSPARGIRLPQETASRPVRFLRVDQVQALADAMPTEYEAVVWAAAVLGLRWSEIAGLRVGRLDPMLRSLTVEETLAEVGGRLVFAPPKSRASQRTIDIPPFVAERVAAHLAARGLTAADAEALVFTGRGGSPLRSANFRTRVWRPAVERAGLGGMNLTFHHLRHTAVGFLIDGNCPPALMQQRMGHASIRTTFDVYGHILGSTQERATEHLESIFSEGPADLPGGAVADEQ